MLGLVKAISSRTLAGFLIILTTLFGLTVLYVGESMVKGANNVAVTPRSLAVIMPINNNTDVSFYKNMWVRDHLRTVCDFDGPDCAMSCNEKSTWKTLHRKTVCFTKQIKERFKSTEFFIKMDDDTFIDRDYIDGLIKTYSGYERPVYISDFILNLDGSNPVLNGSYYGNGKFYMFNRQLLDCIDPTIKYRGDRNEDAIFGAMVYNGCGPDVLKIREDDSKIWHKGYTNKNKQINLAYISNY
ncbi:hypothetical protein GGI21_001725 [Coemansia aciculifera]|uniref:Uncharacterized protein n=1 Tax=Coemansia aciculifera TaxID=417176 RepID=A0ACC1LX58_9FUNG|nr:hypothetical protein IWW38_004728 [Coemansia aciculifera]KAJ2909596.1 hypothetical protein GGI21_001725 [Coemansia aciculifera]